MKVCPKCKESKPATTDFFPRDRKRPDGLQVYCKECGRSYYAANRERVINRMANYRITHREQANESQRAYYETHREQYRAYRESNRGRYIELKRAWDAANREHRRRYQLAYVETNKQAEVERQRKWKSNNRLQVTLIEHRRRARKLAASGSHTLSDIQRQYKAQKGKCYYCGVSVKNKYHVDHIVPLSRGGADSPDNLVIACPHCNSSKGSKLPHEWPQGGRLI